MGKVRLDFWNLLPFKGEGEKKKSREVVRIVEVNAARNVVALVFTNSLNLASLFLI